MSSIYDDDVAGPVMVIIIVVIIALMCWGAWSAGRKQIANRCAEIIWNLETTGRADGRLPHEIAEVSGGSEGTQ